MAPELQEAEESVRRIRRGCTFVALLFVALTMLFVSATGNLFFLTLLLFALLAFVFARLVR
jgi:hypothetical protein